MLEARNRSAVAKPFIVFSLSNQLTFNMPKSWSKPFLAILKDQVLAWASGKKPERAEIVQVVASRIREDLVATGDEEETPEDLEEVCVKLILLTKFINILYKENSKLVQEQRSEEESCRRHLKEEVYEDFFFHA